MFRVAAFFVTGKHKSKDSFCSIFNAGVLEKRIFL